MTAPNEMNRRAFIKTTAAATPPQGFVPLASPQLNTGIYRMYVKNNSANGTPAVEIAPLGSM